MRLVGSIAATLALLATAAPGASLYEPPADCQAIATLRLANCVVTQVSRCAEGNVEDRFVAGAFQGRSFYTHPSLFVRYEGVDGFIVGHAYGEGTPAPDAVLSPGDRFSYERRVYRSRGDAQAGDEGEEVMEVGNRLEIELDGKRYEVLDIRFEVTNEETGYEYRERALMLESPALTLGILGAVNDPEGGENYSTIPESISLEGDPGFRSQQPPASCGPAT